MSATKEKHVDSSALGCAQCRRVRYAKACTGLTTVLSRYQEWAVPFLKLYSRYQVTLQNEMVAKVFKIGMQFRQFLALTDAAYFRAACRFKISMHPCACHLCTCMSVAQKNPTRASHKIVDQPTHSRSLKGKEQGGKNNTRWIKARPKKLQHVQAITGNTCGMQGLHRHSLTIHSVEKCHGTYELRKRSCKGMPEAVSTDINAKSHTKRQQNKCNAVLVNKNGIHYHADNASPLRGRCIGGRSAPVWTSISSTSPSSSSILSTPSAPVCFLCSRCASDYVPFACQKIYSAKCSSCKRANCNQCGNWEGSSFFCKWCFDNITPSLDAIQSAAQQTCKAIRPIRRKILPCRWVGHARKARAQRIWRSLRSIVNGKLGTQNLASRRRKTKDNVEHMSSWSVQLKTGKKDVETRKCWSTTTRPNTHMKPVRFRGGGAETLQSHEHEAWKGSNQKKQPRQQRKHVKRTSFCAITRTWRSRIMKHVGQSRSSTYTKRNLVFRFNNFTTRCESASSVSSLRQLTLYHHLLVSPQLLGSADHLHGRIQFPKRRFSQTLETLPAEKVESKMAVANNTIDVSCDVLGSVVQTHMGKPSIELEHVQPVRFHGGGTEQLQCFMCLAYKSAYVPKQFSDEYVSRCYTCGRGACNNHGSWEVGHFHCALCHATDDGLLAELKDTFAVRCLSKTFQNQGLLHTNEEAFNDLMLTLCTGGINCPRGMGNYDEQGLKVQPQEAAGVELAWDDARQLVEAIVQSRVDTPDDAVKVLGQSWVPTWDGWKELRQCATERCCVAIAERLCDIAQQNAPYQSKTDAQALQALASEGFMWRKALSHGVNNCLIDSLMLCLSYEHILPNNLTTDVTARRRVAAACRKHLIQEIGDEVAPGSNGLFPFLDAHRDGPRIVDFLLHWFRVVARTNMLIHVHDRFGEHAAGADWNKIAVNLGHRYPQQPVLQLHIYNHTSVRGRGYHFDSLLPIPGREAESKKKRSRTVAATNATKIEAESIPTGSQLNDLQREPQRNGGTPEKPSCNNEAAEQQADQRAETVFAKMAWYFHGTTFPISWLDALLANLIFHGYMLQCPDLLARQDARFHLCRTCQANLEPEQLEGDEACDLQHHLAKAAFFFTSGSRSEVSAEVHVYDSTTTDLSVPLDVYTIGRHDSLLVPVFRLYRYKNGRYAALLPANPAEQRVFTSGDSQTAAQGSKQNDMSATCTVMPPTNSFGTIGCAAGIGAATDLCAPPLEQVREILQRFCDQRGADVQVDERDAHRVSDAWWNLDALGIILHTLLQAGLTFADAGMHHARRLANQWRGFYTTQTQGAGKRLSDGSMDAAQKENVGHKTAATDAAATCYLHSTPAERQEPTSTSDVNLSITARKRQAAQQDASASPARKTEMRVPPRRVRRKAPPVGPTTAPTSGTGSLQGASTNAEDIYPLRLWKPSQGNKDPRAAYDFAMQDAAALLSDKPTLPERLHAATDPEMAYDLPDYHCAFRGCGFECATHAALAEHVAQHHATALHDLALRWSSQVGPPQATFQAYQDLLTQRCQQSGPLATCSIDRRCLRRFRSNMLGHQVGTAICFVCARRFPFVDGLPNQQISWLRAYEPRTGLFFDHVPEMLEALLGMSTYHARYVTTLPADTQPGLQSELAQWTCTIACAPYNLRVLACPEDKRCIQRCPSNRLCTHCEIPMCTSCHTRIYRQRMKPREALSNDLFLGHPPRELYAQECTMLELLCASPCMTALTCFSIEWRYLQDRSLAQDALMNRHRLCAKGNATTFPLPWEDLLAEFERLGAPATNASVNMLPHVGKELSDKVAVIIKIGDKTDKEAIRQQIIHQAVIRRRVVVGLIAAMVARSHPAYQGLDMAIVETRAEMLPENDVPAEIIALLDNDGSLNQVLRQKAATPVNDQMTAEEARREFGNMLKPNAVVLEKTSAGCQDVNAQHVSALEEIVARAEPASAQPLPEVTLYTGTKLLDQFQPLYFALAFPFVFPYGIGLPDVPKWSQRQRARRHAADPYVELNTWVRAMARRIEAQVSRDWVFGFTSWNLLFRSALNLSRTTDAYSRTFFDEDTQEWVQPTGRHVEAAAQQLLLALKGSYIDVNGQPRPVKGDVAKLRYVQGLKPMARKLLNNMRHTAQGLPGTQEARKRMRFEIQAMRIRYGVPLFVTFTPDEAHQLLFVRMTRVRSCDPVRAASIGQDFPAGEMFFPNLGLQDAVAMGPFEHEFTLPMSWAERREVLARDPLAAVDGFRVLTHLMLKHLFGVRVCPYCPDCNRFSGLEPCQDLGGSNAEANGGIFGRVDAVYISLEAQKSSGAEHGHMQVFVQCLHQHTSLEEIFRFSHDKLAALRAEYEAYNAHVCHASYVGQSNEDMERRIAAAEASWPTHELDVTMTTIPTYQLRRATETDNTQNEAADWRKRYMAEDVVQLQLLKQHHYHPYNETSQGRVPLAGCQKSDRPGLCKSDFPRTQWLCAQPTVLCPCKLKTYGMPSGGRKNRLGALHGPCGHEWLNGCAPAMLAGLRGANCDVQVPYRLPYSCPTCGDQLTAEERQQMSLAAQRAQDAQTGYCADYCSKGQPMGHGEIREFQKGHEQLHAQHARKPLDDLGKRHANRFLSDAYLKGVMQGQVECCNLRAYHRDDTVVSAERIATTTFESFPGAAFADFVAKYHNGDEAASSMRRAAVKWTRRQSSGVRHLGTLDIVEVYGHRPKTAEVWWLSPYEFVTNWAVTIARVPTTQREWELEERSSWDVSLTAAGLKLIQKQTDPDKKLQLQPGTHYCLAVQTTPGRICLDDGTATAQLRHRCYLLRRRRPCCPHFENSPVPLQKAGQEEVNARLTMTYFRAWTLDANNASANVPFVGRLKAPTETWVQALRMWLTHLPCEETKRCTGNFLSVYRVRPSGAEEANSDDSGIDEPLLVTPTSLPTALKTSFRQTGKRTTAHKAEPGPEVHDKVLTSYEEAAAQAEATWAKTTNKNITTTKMQSNNAFHAHDPAAVRRAIKALNTKKADRAVVRKIPTPGTCEAEARATCEKVDAFLRDLRGTSKCNPEQLAFIETICARVKHEAVSGQERGGTADTNTEALRWALHGGPGTGKSYVLNIARRDLFEECLGWTTGKEFQVVAFQAVNAEPLDGETMHQALGLAWHGNDHNVDAQRILNLAQQAVQWRWLLIDEISMVSAEMLARLEARCRQLVLDVSATKYGKQNTNCVAPFGGLNVILSGDLWQLPPPRGTFLGQIPWHLVTGVSSKKLPLSLQGQQLVWASSAQGGLQGVTELVRCERTQDVWLQDLQAELRVGHLSEDNHAFLHGRPTKVPGSWCARTQRPMCQENICYQLYKNASTATAILKYECPICHTERDTKRLVAVDADDPRFVEGFSMARGIFHTNGVKCHVNKLRAEQWARQQGQIIYYAVATDKVSSRALHEKPDIAQDKLTWLQRSDADCGNRYGVLPLCIGMPVRAREHLHRKDFKILKGCHGTICGWSRVETETAAADGAVIWNKLPDYIFVRFETRTRWTIPGIDQENVFPVSVQSGMWFLDAGRANPQLKVTRYQFPIAPDFADTFYGAQGSTIEPGVIVDMVGADPIAAYIGMTRCRTRQKILIYRPFPLAPFQEGLPLGRQLLLDVWKQEPVDWDALRKKYLEERPCQECGEIKRKDAFTKAQWKQETYRVCKECTAQKREAGTPYRCTQCGLWHAAYHFMRKYQNPRWSMYRVCMSCDAKKQCFVCQSKQTKEHFGAAAWMARDPKRRVCLQCQTKTRGSWKCVACQQRKPQQQFSNFIGKRLSGKEDGTQTCNACHTVLAQAVLRKRAAASSISRLEPLRKKLRRTQVLRETWEAIAEHRKNRTHQTMTNEKERTNEVASPKEREQNSPPEKNYVYSCPFCQKSVTTSIASGHVNHRRVCGRQFRVQDGIVRPTLATTRFSHTCPTCGTCIQSTKEFGRIQCKHKQSNGRVCSRTQWHAK